MPEKIDYLIEYLSLDIQKSAMDGLSEWSEAFTRFRDEGNYDLCQQLLRAVKTHELPLHALGIVHYSEGWLYDRMGRWKKR